MKAKLNTTHWSQVISARDGTDDRAREALEALCRAYWIPLYAYVRHRGYSVEESKDLTQEFFAAFIEKRMLQSVRREKGRFRSFLLASLKNFLANDWHKSRTERRGGKIVFVPLDVVEAEIGLNEEMSNSCSAEDSYRRNWALALLGRARERLRLEHADVSRRARFYAIEPFLSGTANAPSYAELAASLGTSVSAAKVAVHRMRRRYGAVIRQEVADTVANPEDVSSELQELLDAL